MKKVWLSWSTGKDSAWTLYTLRKNRRYEVKGLFTTVTEKFSRVSVHGVREDLLQAQADRLELPLYKVTLPWPCSNKLYQQAMEDAWGAATDSGVQFIAFGDLFLEDIRQYRVNILDNTGLKPIFPIWKQPTRELAATMISSGLRATITCIDPRYLPEDFVGRQFDVEFLDNLPSGVDPCGENGEFHTFVHAGPMFSNPIHVRTGEVVKREGFVYSDVIPCNAGVGKHP
ncbi:MAG: adenine nucleotide alpha hydrolase [Bacteroidota bacterium]|nr:adenine nucleotide alpha hydrolase [Bacteroidota bacterium]MXW15869.1 adenine nucleotide alpha hydrolase [Rhodothermaceae bacterium]MDE2645835.1 adenine nucleotide alpha hydrolase [Bacteroidota bacterium]MXZ17004.1 adenine nucleotide alpha hydrolase [Rhodothermaceae bacterium]MYC03788.1 adenine nucleotide alpha hydrolase [Rhodothermaceae bacterium]